MTITTAAELLPPICYAAHPTEPSIVVIKRGVQGYWRPVHDHSHEGTTRAAWVSRNWPEGRLTIPEIADHLNRLLGVTSAQRQAMLAGSMFGFNVPAADPRHYGG